MYRAKRKGITLAETACVALVIAIAIVSLWKVYGVALSLIVESREISIAADDVRDVFEYIKTIPFGHITDPSNGGFGDGDNVNSTIIGGFTLENESIVVSYPQGIGADPKEIAVDISWSGRNGRAYAQTFRTIRSSGL